MAKRRRLLVLLILLILSSPAYSQGYENINIIKTTFKGVFYIGIFIAVIFVALYGTKLIAKNYKGFSKSKYIELLDVMNISTGSKIIIMKINKKIYIVSNNNSETNVLDIVDEEDFPIIDEDFQTYMDKYFDGNKLSLDKINNIKEIFKKLKRTEDKEGKENE